MQIGTALQLLVGLVLRCGLQAIMAAAHASLTMLAWRHNGRRHSLERKRWWHDWAVPGPCSWREAGRVR